MRYIYMLPAAILVPAIHEFIKALVSTLQGDRTPKAYGYLTLNPFKYIDPIGLILIVMFSGFGWGNPTPTAALHYSNRRRGVLLTYTIPVLVTLLLGIVALAAVPVIVAAGVPMGGTEFVRIWLFSSIETSPRGIAVLLLFHFGIISINFALFNLIPIYPLATNRLVMIFGRPDTIARFNHYEKHMQIILMGALLFGVISMIIGPIASYIFHFAWGLVV